MIKLILMCIKKFFYEQNLCMKVEEKATKEYFEMKTEDHKAALAPKKILQSNY